MGDWARWSKSQGKLNFSKVYQIRVDSVNKKEINRKIENRLYITTKLTRTGHWMKFILFLSKSPECSSFKRLLAFIQTVSVNTQILPSFEKNPTTTHLCHFIFVRSKSGWLLELLLNNQFRLLDVTFLYCWIFSTVKKHSVCYLKVFLRSSTITNQR